MADCARLLTDIDSRIAHIHSQIDSGAPRDDVIAEQHKALLLECSQLRCVDVAMTTRISKHVLTYGVFSRPQLSALDASLRAAISTAPGKHTTRPMQTLDALEHWLLQSDWDQLIELGKQPKQTSDPFEDIFGKQDASSGNCVSGCKYFGKSRCYYPSCHARCQENTDRHAIVSSCSAEKTEEVG